MPRSAVLNERMREESRERILAAALEVFASHGFGGASMRMIAERAGISPGLIYAYFPAKDALLEALFARSMTDVRASFEAADAEPDPRRRIERLVHASFEILARNMDFWRLSYGVRMQAAVISGLEPGLAAWQANILKKLTGYLRGAGVREPALEARLLFAEIDGVAQHFVLDPERYPLRRVLERLVARYR
jgi:AcrR family transcriptional regulator